MLVSPKGGIFQSEITSSRIRDKTNEEEEHGEISRVKELKDNYSVGFFSI